MKRSNNAKNIDEIKVLVIKNYKYFVVGVVFICLIIVLAITGKNRGASVGGAVSENAVSDETIEEIVVPDVALETNAYPAINDLIANYYAVLASGDTEALKGMCSTIDEKELIRIEKKAEYTESNDNLVCYTKPGPEEGSYIVFVNYEIKFKNIATVAPGLSCFYVKTREDGSFYIYNNELSAQESAYFKEVTAQNDVIDLLNEVDNRYRTAIASDSTLASFMEALSTALDTAVSTELAARESQNAEGGSAEGAAAVANVTAKVKETVNVRSSASTEADKLGKISGGDTITVVKNLDNGWSQIDYQGKEGYVKTEYLDIPNAPAQTAEAPAENNGDTAAAEGGNTGAENAGNSDTVAGKLTIKERVRVRSTPSTDSDDTVLGSCDGGTILEYYSESNGWYKVKYNGQTAYVKAEYVKLN